MGNFVEATSDTVTGSVANVMAGDSDTLLILEGVYRAASGLLSYGVEMQARSQTLFLDGTVFANVSVIAQEENASVFIGATGRATGASVGVRFQNFVAFLDNAGQITGPLGVYLNEGGTVINSGIVSGSSIGIFGFGPVRLFNTGLITASSYAVDAGGSDEIINAGTIRGIVRLNAYDDLYDTSDGVTYGLVDLGAGNDTAIGGARTDEIRDGIGADEIDTGAGNDRVLLDPDRDVDTVDGGVGEDLLHFDSESDDIRVNLITGQVRQSKVTDFISGFERVRTGNGNDHVTGDAAANRVWSGNGNDTVLGGDGKDVLAGEEGADSLNGGSGDDRLTGGDGADRLVGGDGNDILQGDFDTDVQTGGAGSDQFVFRQNSDLQVVAGTPFERITDFQHGIDIIDLSGIDANGRLAGDQDFVFVAVASGSGQLSVRQSGGNTFVDMVIRKGVEILTIQLDGLVTVDANDFVL